MSKLPTYIALDEFQTKANDFYERAKKGENIVVTVDGTPKYQLYTNLEDVREVLTGGQRPDLTTNEYDELLEMLDPLDQPIG